jgi:signal transduction histidine kinase
MSALAQSFAGWMLEVSMAAVALAVVVRTGRRREAINEAIHELRRPLQVLALATPGVGAGGGVAESSLRLAAAALERLDQTVNGGRRPAAKEIVRGQALLRSAVGRWRARVAMAGGSLELRWNAGESSLMGDRGGLEAALDNLIVNAIDHGGPPVVVEGRRDGGRLTISVSDAGRTVDPHRGRPEEGFLARLSGRRRHGHGLAIVRRVAAEHGGRFALRRDGAGARAILELPLAEDSRDGA